MNAGVGGRENRDEEGKNNHHFGFYRKTKNVLRLKEVNQFFGVRKGFNS
jgi:hypothetical protein